MKKPMPVLKTILSACLSIATGFGAQDMPTVGPGAMRRGSVLIPESSVARLQDYGLRAHTNHAILAPEMMPAAPESVVAEPDTTQAAAPQRGTPAAFRAVYGLPSTGGAGMIAIVDAYDDPAAESDLGRFSSQFGLPLCTTANGCFRKVYSSGPKPTVSCGWAQEADLDIEWAHAIAPNAKITLVEAASNGSADLAKAIGVASSIVNPSGRGFGEVSMSWGFTEFASETAFDHNFSRAGVVYVASAGDVGGVRNYPATSPYVVAAGGTTLQYNTAGQFVGETTWSSAGGGPSTYEPRPSFQAAIASRVGTHRGTPDLAFDANPNTGAWVYDSTPCGGLSGWLMFGGTSLSAPAIAGVINLAGHFYSSSGLELSTIYSHLGTVNFRDITTGQAGSYRALAGWDFATGVGASKGLVGK